MWLSTNTLCRLCTTPGALLSLSADSLHINVLQSHDKLVHNTSQKLCLWHEDDTESESIRGVLIGEKFPLIVFSQQYNPLHPNFEKLALQGVNPRQNSLLLAETRSQSLEK